MKVAVVIGALGMAGHVMAEYLESTGEYKVLGVARQPGLRVSKVLDVLDFLQLEAYLKEVGAQVVVNCVGALVSDARDHISRAILLNSYLPHYLAELGDKYRFRLIHISTDCVFSGEDGNYLEASFRDGDDNYARTKALGEVAYGQHLTIRTSIIGAELKDNGTGLMDWFFKQHGTVTGYSQAYWSGVTTLELAKATHEFIYQNVSGLVHLCPESKISKFELLDLINEIWQRDCSIESNDSYVVDKSLISTRSDLTHSVPSYRAMLEATQKWLESRVEHYPHYKFL